MATLLKLGVSKKVAVVLILISLTAASIVAPKPVSASSKTITVPDDYATVQAAVDSANDGDTVFVKKGIYHENLKINKSLSLVGEDRDATIIDGNSSESSRTPVTITHDNVTVAGFTFRDGWTGIRVSQASYCDVSGNRITNVQYGVALSSASGNSITANIIDSVKTNGYGIELNYAANNSIKRNQIISASIGIAIRDQLLSPTDVVSSKNNNVSENSIASSKEYAIMLQYTNDNVFIGNNISKSGIGTSIYVASDNYFYHNNFVDNAKQVDASGEWYAEAWGFNVPSVNRWNENYWSDYNGTDNNHDGIGDVPYVIYEKNQDDYPLMAPSVISSVSTELPELASPSPSPSPSPSLSPSTSPSHNPAPLSTTTIVAFAVSAAVVVAGLIIYFRKREH